MNNGASIPYHLRVNKAIDRNLFMDLLKCVGKCFDLKDYVYIGMGGPFLEDFKSLHANFIFKDMVSIDCDQTTTFRQQFNKPFSCINILNESSGSFITRYDFSDPTITWFDYTSFETYNQLNEVQSLISNLNQGDCIKITLNANASNLDNKIKPRCNACEFSGLLATEKNKARQDVFMDIINDFAPQCFNDDAFLSCNFPTTLLKCLHVACKRGIREGSGLYFQPLSAFEYADGQRMLSACGIILESKSGSEFLEKSGINLWSGKSLGWENALSISVPDLSVRERLALESELPGATVDQIIKDYPFFVPNNNSKAKKELRNFIQYYRQYPHYSRVLY